MKHHTSILIFLVTFSLIMILISHPVRHIVAANVVNTTITACQADSISAATGIIVPATVTTTQSYVAYLLATLGSFLTVIIMSLLKFFFPNVFGAPGK